MLKIIEKSLLLSLFACSFVFPMNQLARTAIARTLGKSASFHNSLISRCPLGVATVVMTQMIEQVPEVEVKAEIQNSMKIDATVDRVFATNYQETATDNQAMNYQDVVTDNQVFAHINQYEMFEGQQRRVCVLADRENLNNWQASSLVDNVQNRLDNNDKQSSQHLSRIANNGKVKAIVESIVATEKSKLSVKVDKLLTSLQNPIFQLETASEFINNHVSDSNYELRSIKEIHVQDLFQTEKELNSLMTQNDKVALFVNAERNFSNHNDCESLRLDIKKTMSLQDLGQLKQALALEKKIEIIKAEIHLIDSKFKQEANNLKETLD